MAKEHYEQILKLFSQKNINYLLLRYPHIIPREIHDLDLLVESEEGYHQARSVLQQHGFIVLEQEHHRSFWAKKEKSHLLVVDLYQEVSWMGFIVLNKARMFERKKKISAQIIIPSPEDDLLVYLAQALFKNWSLNEYKSKVVRTLLQSKLDLAYISNQTRQYGWDKAGQYLLDRIEKTTGQKNIEIIIPKIILVSNLLPTFFHQKGLERISFLKKVLSYPLRAIKQYKTPLRICLLGPDGSGKSTIVNRMTRRYEEFYAKFDVNAKQLYFGWELFLPTSKIISRILQKKKVKIVEKMNQASPKHKFNMFQELLLSYYFLEYLGRYYWKIPLLSSKRSLIILDRYFYDIYVHYRYAQRSVLFKLWLKMYPQPNFIFLLNPPIETLLARKNDLTLDQATEHHNAYQKLATFLPLVSIDTSKWNEEETEDFILNQSWKKIVQRVA